MVNLASNFKRTVHSVVDRQIPRSFHAKWKLFDVFVSYDVPGQARDLSNVLKSLLQSGNKPGKAGKVSLFTQLQTLTKENMASYMGSGACWTVESLASN